MSEMKTTQLRFAAAACFGCRYMLACISGNRLVCWPFISLLVNDSDGGGGGGGGGGEIEGDSAYPLSQTLIGGIKDSAPQINNGKFYLKRVAVQY